MTILGTSMPCGEKKERCRDGVACVVFLYPVLPVHCHLYTYIIVSVVFGTAIPTSPTLLENVFHTSLCTFSCTIVHKMLLQVSFKIQQTYQ